jgi:uncharacterized protein YecE (DUF72 family)
MSQKLWRPHVGGKILVGTASWSDPGFVQHWYPKKLKAGERLAWYSQHFEMVEVNSTFYSVPDARTVERWCASTPSGFTFDVKLHQLFSFHSTAAKLLPPELQRIAETDAKGRVKSTPQLQEKLLRIFLATMKILQRDDKLGVLLLQLSPAFSPRAHRLEELRPLIEQLAAYPVAIELRNRNWVIRDELKPTIDFFRECGAIFVNVDAPAAEHFTIMPANLNEITNPAVAYLRLHGRNARAYITGRTVAARFDYDYDDNELEEIATRSGKLAQSAKEAHIVFNNNNLDYAPRAALRLRAALRQILNTPSRQPELFAKG